MIFERLLKGLIRRGELSIILANGATIEAGKPNGKPKMVARFHDSWLPYKLMRNLTLGLGEGYMAGDISFDQGSLREFLDVLCDNLSDGLPQFLIRCNEVFSPLAYALRPTSKSAARKNVAHHYEYSVDFFKMVLDRDLQYTCAYFANPNDDLDTAQLNKNKLVASKLLLKKGMRVLEIGAGCGGLSLFLAREYGVQVTGLSLSEEWLAVAQERARSEGLDGLVKFHLRDYREELGLYDRVVSVGMFEHVGVAHYAEYFAKIRSCLVSDGIALVHSIGSLDGPGAPDSFLEKYIFPGGYAPALSEVLPVVERSGLFMSDLEILRLHYVPTLASWLSNFNKHREQIAAIYDERFCRMWEFYLIFAEMCFRHLAMMVFQMQLGRSIDAVPLTRKYMFDESNRLRQAGTSAGVS